MKLLLMTLFISFFTVSGYAQTIEYTLDHQDVERSYKLFVPEHYDSDEVGHLILVLHGGGMTSSDMINHTGQRFNELVEAHMLNVLVVYPSGIGRGWNDGRIREGQVAYEKGIDDVSFLLTLAETLAIEYNIVSDELYIAGFSNGAGMAYRLACESSDEVVAIAPVANTIASTLTCEPEHSVAILSIVGDEDPILPLSGGDLYYWDIPLGSVLSLDDTLLLWHEVNGCDGYTSPVILPDSDPDDETTISKITAVNCEKLIQSMIIHGGGHTWAGSPLYMPEDEFGRRSNDIDASDMIFEFFISVGLGEGS